ncbi:hypothetical protein KKD61_05300 [Patescibacteria group bacterium]|nr:hypothetical protein [Patescibacteria group bacterium]
MKKFWPVIVLLLSFYCFFWTKPCLAESGFVNVVNPVRGNDFWSLSNQNPEDFPLFQSSVLAERELKATWLLRPDLLFNQELSALFTKEAFASGELGIFLEVTPAWAENSGVDYNQDGSWSRADKVFLSGYNRDERKRLLITAFSEFKEKFGFYPKTVGAWNIDAYSASLLKEKYALTSVLICADQFSTDGYQIWGGWWGVPFYPNKKNLLFPAAGTKDKLDVLVFWWAARDPLNGYGSGVENSTFSVQPNDYLKHGLDTEYFSKLADLYLFPDSGRFGQLTIGLENDNSLLKYKNEFLNQVEVLLEKEVVFITVSEFSDWYRKTFPDLSPPHSIGGADLLGGQTEAYWSMDDQKRLGVLKEAGIATVRDFRFYRPVLADPYSWNENTNSELYWNVPAKIDSVSALGQEKSSLESILSQEPSNKPFESNWFWVFWIVLLAIFLIKKAALPFWVSGLVIISGLLFSLPMLKSGLIYDFGLGFWGPNGHDGVWHLSLIGGANRSLPPENMIFSGTKISGYHWGFDLLASIIGRVFKLPILDVYFRFLPLAFAFLIGFLSLKLALAITGRLSVGIWFLLLNFFAGSFGWLVTLFRQRDIGGESLFWSMQSISTLINPPYALSLVVLLLGLYFWFCPLKRKTWVRILISGILFGLLGIIKIYASLLVGLSVAFVWVYKLITKDKSSTKYFYLCLTIGLVSLVSLMAAGAFKGGSYLVFKPLWFTHSLVESLDKLYLPRLAAFRINLSQQWLSFKLPVFLLVEMFLVLIFLIGNLGIRIFGLPLLFKKNIGLKNGASRTDPEGIPSGYRDTSYCPIGANISYRKTNLSAGLHPVACLPSISAGLPVGRQVNRQARYGVDRSSWYWDNDFRIFSIIFLFISFLLPTLFVQKGTTWNTIQFFYYFLFLANFYLSLFLDSVFAKKGFFFKALVFLIFAFGLPTTFSTLKGYLGFPPPAAVPNYELYALDFLKNQPDGFVLAFPFDSFKKSGLSTPLPLYLYETTAYVSAFSSKPVFLEDEMNLEITGFPWRQRKEDAEKFFSTNDKIWARGFLLNNNIDYIYLVNGQNFRFQLADLGLKMIFNNGQAKIYQVLK